MNFDTFQQQFHLTLNAQQAAAVKTISGPVLLLAVPGSGKTTVLVSRLGYMLYGCGIAPSNILVMTYTVAAARDMRHRFCQLFGNQFADKLYFRTINSIALGVINHYENVYRRTAFDMVTDDSRCMQYIGEAYRKTTGDYADESDRKDIRTQITYIKNMCLSDEDIDALKSGNTHVGPIYREYCRFMRENRLMDYDDQLVYAYQILQKCPDILAHYQQQYRYLCVDEAQDTSKIQHKLIRLLAAKHHNLFMVGDEDQSIYGFRAAYPQALTTFREVYPEAVCLLMETNYRSTRQIVNAADTFIQANHDRYPKHMITDNAEGSPIEPLWAFDRKAQYEHLADLAAGCTQVTAVLYRDNDSALPLIDLLSRRNSRYRCRQLDSTFFTHKIVRDITDIIRLAYAPGDDACFLRIYYKLNAGINKVQAATAAGIAQKAQAPVFAQLLNLSSLSDWSQKRVKALVTHLSQLPHDTAQQAIARIVDDMGYGQFLARNNSDTGKVDILAALAAQVDTPVALLARLDELDGIVKAGTTDPNAPFILSTIHSSKGLEYPHVILADVIDGILPKLPPDNASDAHTIPEEERRLFYVAMTRAKTTLQLVRFRKSTLTSAFAVALYPPKRQAIPKAPPNMAFHGAAQRQDAQKASEKARWVAKDYIVTARVKHKKYGLGTITEKTGTTVCIRFDDATQKQFDLITALGAGALSLLS